MEKIYEILNSWHEILTNPDRLLYAAAALGLTAIIGVIIGPISGNANPLYWQGINLLFGRVGDKLDRAGRPPADLVFRGFLITFFAIIIALFLGKIIKNIEKTTDYGVFIEILVLSALLTSGSVWFALLRLYRAMEKKQPLKGAYFTLARSARVNLAKSDDFAITRSAIGFTACSFDKGMVAPVIWYFIFGLPGALIYATVAALAWRFGRNGTNKIFTAIPQSLEKLMGIIPSMLTALIMTLAGFFSPTAKLHKGIASWLGSKGRAIYEQGGMPLSAMAWTLNITLGGPMQAIGGEAIKAAWVGPEKATAKIEPAHLRRAILISITAHLLFLCALLAAYIWSGQFFVSNA